jgi:hypothetical protein
MPHMLAHPNSIEYEEKKGDGNSQEETVGGCTLKSARVGPSQNGGVASCPSQRGGDHCREAERVG